MKRNDNPALKETEVLTPEQIVNFLDAAAGAGLRVEVSWGVMSTFMSNAKHMRVVSVTPSPHSERFKHAALWQMRSEKRTIGEAITDLVARLPPLTESEVIAAPAEERQKQEDSIWKQ